MRFRFPIAGLMAAVLVVAVGFAGLRAASLLWASALFSTAIALFAAVIVGAVVSQGLARARCLGFAIFGITYLLVAFWLWPAPNGISAPPFLTKVLLDHFQPSFNTVGVMTIDPGPIGEFELDPRPIVGALPAPAPTTGPAATAPFAGRFVNLLHFRRIGHTLAAIVFALLGSLVGSLLASGRAAAGGRRRSNAQEITS
jgi:hypothetical protein